MAQGATADVAAAHATAAVHEVSMPVVARVAVRLRGLVAYAARIRATLRRRLPAIAAFTALMWLFEYTRAASLGFFAPPSPGIVALYVALVMAVVVAPALVEAAGLRGWRGGIATVAVMGGLLALVAWSAERSTTGPLGQAVEDGVVQSNATFLLRVTWTYAVAGLLFAVFCHVRDRELATIHAARTATLERAGAERDIVEMRLQVIQARVEPEILFGALGDVRATYAQDPVAADGLLDDLISYLRAALPDMRRGASTVLREARLAEAYLRVLPAGRDGRVIVDVAVDDAARDAAFPSLVLLPLVHAAVDAGAARITIRASVDADGRHALGLSLDQARLPAGWSGDALTGVRAIVTKGFGASSTLLVSAGDGQAMVRIAWRAEEAGPASLSASGAGGAR
jgi:hypothetical protein